VLKPMNEAIHSLRFSGNEDETAARAAAYIIRTAREAVRMRGIFTLALSGGASPRPVYRNLARGLTPEAYEHSAGEPVPQGDPLCDGKTVRMPWHATRLYWSDERCVPPTDSRSNYRMARETLFAGIGPEENLVFRMPGELSPGIRAAEVYETELRKHFNRQNCNLDERFPVFDLVMLGMGEDGHIASLFRDNPLDLAERSLWVKAVKPPSYALPAVERLTLTLPVINHARCVLFFTTGSLKAAIAETIMSGKEKALPASLVRPRNGSVCWFCAQP
jgi:6-phosphogluconolactonase